MAYIQDVSLMAQKSVTVGMVTYVGYASPGTLTSAAAWQVKKIDNSTAGTTIVTFSDGNANFDNIFDNYLTLSYQ